MPIDLSGLPDKPDDENPKRRGIDRSRLQTWEDVAPKRGRIDLSGLPDKPDNGTASRNGIDRSRLHTRADMLATRYRNTPTSPDEYARIRDLSKRTGLPKVVTQRNLSEAEKMAAEPDWQGLEQSAPTASLKLAKDVEFFRLAHDDADQIGALERTLKAAGAGTSQAVLALAESILRTPQAANRWLASINEAGEALGLPEWMTRPVMGNPLDAIERGVTVGDYHAAGTTEAADAIADAQRRLAEDPATFGETFARLGEKAQQADAAFTQLMEGNPEPIGEVLTDPEAWAGFISQAAPSLYTAYKSGGSIPFLAWLEGMEAANDAAEFERRTGQRLSPAQFTQAQAQVALVNSVLERFGLDRVFGNAGRGKLSGFIRGALSEGGTEGLQQFNTNLAALAAYDRERSLGEGVLGSVMGGAGTGGPAGMLSALGRASGPDSEFTNTRQRVAQAQRNAETLAELSEQARASKLAQRSASTFEQYVAEAAQDGPVQEVYIEAERFAQYFQEQGIDPEQIAQQVPSLAGQLQDAIASGSDLRIPIGEYLARIATTEHNAGLMPHVRFRPEDMSQHEAQLWQENIGEQFQAEIEKTAGQQTEADTWQASAAQVQAQVREQIARTGRFTDDVADKYAALHRAFAETQAQRLGILPHEVYERYPLQVRRARMAGDQLDQTPTLDDIQTRAREAGVDLSLRERGDVLTLDKIVVPEAARGQGTGSEIMQALAEYADANGKAIALTPSADFGGDPRRLRAFYQRFGFKDNKGGDKAFTVSESMLRMPQGSDLSLFQPAYHGSPHTFDRFSLEAIGTGEGAQAYGWGLYFAGKREVAEFYKDAGLEVSPRLRMVWEDHGYDVEKTRAALQQAIDEDANGGAEVWQPVLDELNSLPQGNVYQVDIPDDNELLDWDKPLSEQPEGVRENLAPALDLLKSVRGLERKPIDSGKIHGDTLYRRLAAVLSEPSKATAQAFKQMGVDPTSAEAGAMDGTQAASRYLNSLGIPGLRYFDQFSRAQSEGTHNYVIWDENAATIEAVNDQLRQAEAYEQAQRGAFNPDTNTISLLENADLSTFLHESGHFFLEVMADLAGQEGSPASIQQDMQTLLDWFGIEDITTWRGMSLEEKRAHHEQFARAFEAYLFEGKAPSLELQGLFQRFRAWLLNVYRSLRSLNVELTDEVRGVMDRMLASDALIQTAEQARAYGAMFESAEQAGMTPEEWQEYQALGEQATAESTAELQRKGLRDMRWLSNAKSRKLKQLQREADDRRKAVREEVAAEVMARPAYRARQFLKRGEAPGPGGETIQAEGAHKLSIPALKALYDALGTETDWQALGYGKYGMLAEDGLSPDLVAEWFGFSSGDHLVQALLDAEPPQQVIEALTDQRMLERYGDLTNPETLERAAEAAIHNEARARFISRELNALDAAIGPKRDLSRAAKEYADQLIARLRVSEAVRAAPHLAAESRAAREAERALRQGDTARAARFKRDQLINNAKARAAYAAEDEVDKIQRYLSKFNREGVRKNLRGDFVDQIDQLLARFDLRKSTPLREIEERKTLREWVEAFVDEHAAIMPEIDPRFLNDAFRKHYKDMTLEELRGLRDTVKQLEHLARREQEMYLAQKDMTFQEEKAEIIEELRAANPDAFEFDGEAKGIKPDYAPSIKAKLARSGERYLAEFLNIENLSQIMTGGKLGQLHRSVMQRLSDRADWKISKMRELGDYLKPYMKQYSLKERRRFGTKGIYIPEIEASLTRENILHVALYYGSETGRQRLHDGHGWSDAQIRAIIKHLDARDWKLADALWRMMDDMIWPELEALNKRTRGKSPPKVQPLPFSTPHGRARGGYFPIVYDADLDHRQRKYDAADAVQEMLGGNVWRADTRQGSSQQRMTEVNKHLRLDFSGMNKALGDTLHDLAFREAVADAYRIVNDKHIRGAIETIGGVEVWRAFDQRIREVAAAPHSPSGWIETVLTKARQNTLVVAMGYSFKTFLINATGIFPAAARVGSVNLARQVATFYSPKMRERWDFVMTRSEYMRNRNQDFERDLAEAVKKFSVKGKLTPEFSSYFVLIAWMDRGVSVPVWLAAYQEAMQDGNNDETAAIQHADHVVRSTQGSGRSVDLSRIQSGTGGYGQFKRLFTMFYSYFNAQLGALTRSGIINARAAREGDPKAIAKLFADFTAIVLMPAITGAMLYGRCDGEEESYVKCFGREVALYTAGFFPVVRDFVAGLWAQIDDDAPYYGYQISPVQSAFEGVVRAGGSAADVAAGEGDKTDAKNLTLGTSYLFGLPGYQVWRTADHLESVYSGDSDLNPWYALMGEPRDD